MLLLAVSVNVVVAPTLTDLLVRPLTSPTPWSIAKDVASATVNDKVTLPAAHRASGVAEKLTMLGGASGPDGGQANRKADRATSVFFKVRAP